MVNLKDALRYVFQESSCLGLQLKMGGKFLLKLNIGERPIANKKRLKSVISTGNQPFEFGLVGLKSFKAFGFVRLGSLGALFRTPLTDYRKLANDIRVHGSKESNIYASVWVIKPLRVMKVILDPKDGELCLNRVKLEGTLVEARSGSDVQIDRQIWV
ncbi:13485_t:CDS:2 [Funneliformis mosseae]|uniref:13485_t:CDS:1 n=1 Tax=Funneliformis mosseae TaxID=27381 RepID=A0A9N9BHV9_FUNMO|nr:13485_t:CDS:2 [Funneliformis mosseae]